MKKGLLGILMLVIMFLTACATRIYGVPEERWQTMSEQERIVAMEAYKARQETLRQRRAEQARLRAMEKQAQLEREAEEARRRQIQIDAIYRGEGLYGDLLRVTLEGGLLEFYGAHKSYHPVSFKIAANEIKDIEIVSQRGRKAHMNVLYDGSNLLLDEAPRSHRSTALRLPYENAWENGATYTGLYAKGPLEIRGINVSIQVVGQPPHDHHKRRHPPKVVVQPPERKHQRPGVIVIRQPEPKPNPVVVVVGKNRQKKHPDVIVVKTRPEKDKRGKAIERRSRGNKMPTGYPDRIKVVLRNGHLKVKKSSYPLVAQTIELSDGEIRNVIVRSKRGNLKIRVSYMDGELLINDTPGHDGEGTRLGFTPTWKEGQGYVIEASTGRRMENIDMLIVSQ